MSTAATPSIAAPPAWRMSHANGLWLLGSLIITFIGASTAPSPLYAIYREAWGFSALTLTLVFSIYAFALLGALLVFGRVSDHRGRRAVTLGALALEIAAILLFRNADSVTWLFAARALQGLATGIATAAISAALLDFHRERGALVNSVAPIFGMAAGALGASSLVQFAPAPIHVVFDALLIAFALQAVGALFLPESVQQRPMSWQSLKPDLSIPTHARRVMWTVMPLSAAQWALGGFYLSLGPTLAKAITGSSAPLIGGALIGALLVSAAASIIVVRHRDPRTALVFAAGALAAGVALTLVGMQLQSTAVLFAGTVIAGLGFGASFNGSIRSVVPLAAPHERAGLMSSFFVLNYLAFSVPAVVAGLATGWFGLVTTASVYAAVLIALFTAALVKIQRERSA